MILSPFLAPDGQKTQDSVTYCWGASLYEPFDPPVNRGAARAGKICVSLESRIPETSLQILRLPPGAAPGGKAASMLLASRLRDTFPFFYGWVVVAAASTAVFARMAPAITTLTVLIYPMSQQLGWNRTLISGAVSAGALASLVLSPVVGWAIDRYGARPVLVVSVVALGLAMTTLAWATIPVTFYVAFAVARVVFHTSAPIGASTVASRWFIRKRGQAIGGISS